MNLEKYVSSFFILLIGFFLIKEELRIDGQFGMMEPVLFIFKWIIISGIIVRVILKWPKKEERAIHNYLPILTTILIVIFTLIANRITNYKLNREDEFIVVTTKHRIGQPDTLKLKSSGDYYTDMGEIEWSYRQSGKFKINMDTLHLDKIVTSDRGDTVFRNVYIFNSDRKYLIPINKQTISSASSEYLVIEKKNYR